MVDGVEVMCLREEHAFEHLGRSQRWCRKHLDVLYAGTSPSGSKHKRDRLYSVAKLDAWIAKHGTLTEERSATTSRNKRKHRPWTDENGVERHASDHKVYYKIWKHMMQRCHKPSDTDCPDYGGRGIHVYEPWRKDPAAFYEHLDKLGVKRLGETPGPNRQRRQLRARQSSVGRRRHPERQPSTAPSRLVTAPRA